MRKLTKGAVGAALSSALLIGIPGIGYATPAVGAEAAITCESATNSEKPFYDGDSASKVYDARFSQSAKVPYLDDGYTPQGMAYWSNWDLNGNSLLLITAYKDGQNSRIYGIDPATNKHVGSVEIASAHVGGIAVVKNWAFVAGRSSTIRKYDLAELRDTMKQSGMPYVKQSGTARNVYGASFLGTDGTTLYSGKFNENSRDSMYAYQVGDDGSLTTGKRFEVPQKTQGMTVGGGKFIYSTSYGRKNRSNIYVVDEGATDIDPTAKCFRAPSGTEGVTDSGGRLYLLYETGSSKFNDPRPRNKIQHVHQAKVSDVIAF